jgi:branched-chain amino acid transport system ATP-binding protein
LFDRLTVYENLLAGAYLRGSTGILRSALMTARARQERREAETVARDILAFVGMGNSAEARPRQLSYAQRKRVEFARALIGSPRLVLLDEPLVGLNAADRAAMTQLILRVREELGIAFLIAERAIPFVMGNADRIVVLDGGRVVAQGSPREIHADPAAIAASG